MAIRPPRMRHRETEAMNMQAVRDSLSAAELAGFIVLGDAAVAQAGATAKAGKSNTGKPQRGMAKVGKPQVGKRQSAKAGKVPNGRFSPSI